MKLELEIKRYLDKFEKFLKDHIENLEGIESILSESMRYSLFSGGKRIRPMIMLAMFELCGGTSKEIYRFASAIEMIHTYSLIHDDLPCMDDDEFRRGKYCNHIVYGEDMAVLAGDALLTLAFETVTTEEYKDFNALDVLKSIRVLSQSSGCRGMICGQSFELNTSINRNKDELFNIYNLKTAVLISASAEIGAILAGASGEKIMAARNYGKYLGICFQLVDDIIDKEKLNIAAFENENPNDLVQKLTSKAKQELDIFENDASFLNNLADFLMFRIN